MKTLNENEDAQLLHCEVVSFLFSFLAELSAALPGLGIRNITVFGLSSNTNCSSKTKCSESRSREKNTVLTRPPRSTYRLTGRPSFPCPQSARLWLRHQSREQPVHRQICCLQMQFFPLKIELTLYVTSELLNVRACCVTCFGETVFIQCWCFTPNYG